MKKVLIFGSNGSLAQDYIKRFPDDYLLLDKLNSDELFEQTNSNEIKFDICNFDHYHLLASFLKANSIKIKGIIFFQGVNFKNDLFSLTSNDWDTTFNTNLKSIVFSLKFLFPYIGSNCSIVILASQNGVVAHENRLDYGTSKAATIHLVKNLSIEFAKVKNSDIKVNSVSPGYVYSSKSKEYLDSYKGEILKNKIPYKRFILPEDVSNAIYFLMSNHSQAIRGQNLIIDYGYTLI